MRSMLKTLMVAVAFGAVAAVAVWMVVAGSGKARFKLGKSFEYNTKALEQVAPELIAWQELDPINPGLSELRGLAVGPDDAICVAGDKVVMVLGPDGEQLRSITLEAAPMCLAVDENGLLYIGMKDHVEVYDAGGAKKDSWLNQGDRAFLTSIAVADDSVYVADAGNRWVTRYDTNGKNPGRITGKNDARNVNGFFVPSPNFDVATDEGRSVWIVDPGRHAIVQYRASGEVITSWGNGGVAIDSFCGCCSPSHIALRSDGSFVTSERGLERVKVHGPGGEFINVVVAPKDFDDDTEGMDLAVDSNDRILVLDPSRKQVRVFVEKE